MIIGRGPTGTSSSQDLLPLITEAKCSIPLRQAIAEEETGHIIRNVSFLSLFLGKT